MFRLLHLDRRTSKKGLRPPVAAGRTVNAVRWEHFSHVADMGVRGYGRTMAQAFEQAALALTAAVGELGAVRPLHAVPIECQNPDAELLLADWLNAVVFEMATRHMLFSRFDVHIEHAHLAATAWGEAIDRERHRPAVEAKGATYTELRVRQQEDGTWLAQCVVDV